ncbi:MAG: prepilin peptidase, partial [Candidatus Blackburnbacteria bacterium]|nr:prepilin peptidase [Candidatus Blackburnbacteria bacterium]
LLIFLLFTFYFLLSLPSPLLFDHLLWGTVSAGFFLFLFLVTRGRGMGFGDVKLSFVLGSLLGYPASLVWLFLAFLTGGAIGIILILAGKARFGQHIPFGPFLLFAAAVAFGFGEVLFKWYLLLL